MTKRFFLYYYFIIAYIKTILFLKGFRIFEDHQPIVINPSRNYRLHTNNEKTILFTLYKVPQQNIVYRFGFFKIKRTVNYFLKIEVEKGLPDHLVQHNRMKLQSIGFFIPEKEEDLFLQILVSKYMDYVKKFRN
jgi:hypothetical protein